MRKILFYLVVALGIAGALTLEWVFEYFWYGWWTFGWGWDVVITVLALVAVLTVVSGLFLIVGYPRSRADFSRSEFSITADTTTFLLLGRWSLDWLIRPQVTFTVQIANNSLACMDCFAVAMSDMRRILDVKRIVVNPQEGFLMARVLYRERSTELFIGKFDQLVKAVEISLTACRKDHHPQRLRAV